MPFFRFLFDFLIHFVIKKIEKGRFYSTAPQCWRGVLVDVARSWRGARDQRADATRHWGHMAGPRVAHTRRRWHGHVAGGHAGPRRRPWGAPHGMGVDKWRAHGLVGPGKYIGAVTQMRTAPLCFIVAIFCLLFCVGLCPAEFTHCRWRGRTVGVGWDHDASIA